MDFKRPMNRRLFIGSAALAGASASLLGGISLAKGEEEMEEEVSALEDLMREHGVLNRALLIYEECQRRIRGNGKFDPKALNETASIIKNFIESYHEKLEEEFVFPRLEKAGKYADLCRTLQAQHDAGRKITSNLIELSKGSPNKSAQKKIDAAITGFVRMYRPHEAFEDTVVFPAFKKILSKREYDGLGEKFEDREHEQLGKEGFEGVLDHVADIEKRLSIHDIKQFTPKGA